jgi:hypothetical protein
MNQDNTNQESRGLGDTIDKITTATGIKKIVKIATGVPQDKPCTPCEERRRKLNEMFPYKQEENK